MLSTVFSDLCPVLITVFAKGLLGLSPSPQHWIHIPTWWVEVNILHLSDVGAGWGLGVSSHQVRLLVNFSDRLPPKLIQCPRRKSFPFYLKAVICESRTEFYGSERTPFVSL